MLSRQSVQLRPVPKGRGGEGSRSGEESNIVSHTESMAALKCPAWHHLLHDVRASRQQHRIRGVQLLTDSSPRALAGLGLSYRYLLGVRWCHLACLNIVCGKQHGHGPLHVCLCSESNDEFERAYGSLQ